MVSHFNNSIYYRKYGDKKLTWYAHYHIYLINTTSRPKSFIKDSAKRSLVSVSLTHLPLTNPFY